MKFILGERSGIAKSLSNVFFLEVWQFLNDLGGRHTIRNKVHYVRNGNAKAADCRPTGKKTGILSNAVEGLGHDCLLTIV